MMTISSLVYGVLTLVGLGFGAMKLMQHLSRIGVLK